MLQLKKLIFAGDKTKTMKAQNLLLTCVAAATLLMSCAGRGSDGWQLVWTEDFDGPAIDDAVWSRVPNQKSDWSNMMSLRQELAYIDSGALVLLGEVADPSKGDTTAYVSAGVWSLGKKSFVLPKVEIRAKFNSVQGFWPALWLMPDTPVKDGDYAEVDIMEHTNLDGFVYQTVHSRYTLNGNKQIPPSATAGIDPADWNIYACEMYPDSVCLFTNGIKTLTYPRVEGEAMQFPWADYPFYLILSNQLEGGWVGKIADPADLPTELRIDWIKVYTRTGE